MARRARVPGATLPRRSFRDELVSAYDPFPDSHLKQGKDTPGRHFSCSRFVGKKALDFLVAPIMSIATPDKYPVRLTLTERSPGFPPNLASAYAFMQGPKLRSGE
jgi:hypothetical protein